MAALLLSHPMLPVGKHHKAPTSTASLTTLSSSEGNVIKNSHFTSAANSPLSTNRRSANYQSTIWLDSYIQSLQIGFTEEKYTSRRMELMEDVRSLIRQPRGIIQQLELFDTLRQIGVAYYFEMEIKDLLEFHGQFNKRIYKEYRAR